MYGCQDTIRGIGTSGGVGGVKDIWGAGRDCRYSGARKGIGSIRGIRGLLGV